MDCLHECYSFTFYAPVTLEKLMPCKFANQIAPVDPLKQDLMNVLKGPGEGHPGRG